MRRISIEEEKTTVLAYLLALREVSDFPEQRQTLHASLMPTYDPSREARIDRAISLLLSERKIERTSKGFYRAVPQ